MLTGPVYGSIQGECNWIEALNCRHTKAGAQLLGTSVSQVNDNGTVLNRATLLAHVADGRFGTISMTGIDVPFSSGSTNIVVST